MFKVFGQVQLIGLPLINYDLCLPYLTFKREAWLFFVWPFFIKVDYLKIVSDALSGTFDDVVTRNKRRMPP